MTERLDKPTLASARECRLANRLLDAIQFYIFADATKEDVADLIRSLDDGQGFDDYVAAIVELPDGVSSSEAQQIIDTGLTAYLNQVAECAA